MQLIKSSFEKILCNCSVISKNINEYILVPHCGQFSQKLVHSLILTVYNASESISESTSVITLTWVFSPINQSVEATLAPNPVFLGMMTSFVLLDLGIFCQFPLQILSIHVSLDGDCWWTATLRSLQRCLIAFKSGLSRIAAKSLLCCWASLTSL